MITEHEAKQKLNKFLTLLTPEGLDNLEKTELFVNDFLNSKKFKRLRFDYNEDNILTNPFFRAFKTINVKHSEIPHASTAHVSDLTLQKYPFSLNIEYEWFDFLMESSKKDHISKKYIIDKNICFTFKKDIKFPFTEHFEHFSFLNREISVETHATKYQNTLDKDAYLFILNHAFSFNSVKEFEDMLLLNHDIKSNDAFTQKIMHSFVSFNTMTHPDFILTDEFIKKFYNAKELIEDMIVYPEKEISVEPEEKNQKTTLKQKIKTLLRLT